jgi:2-methylcitrate dehydratase PrpD
LHRSSVPDGGLTAGLASLAIGLDAAKIAPRTVERAKTLVADHVGVAMRGFDEPWTRIVRDTALAEQAAPVAALYDGTSTSARNAAMVNGTAGHALELDDTHDRSLTHPGTVVIAAGVAMAQQTRSSGSALLAAIVAGYEVQGRIGMHIGQAMIERGVHPTAALGVFGAAVAAGRLLALDAAAMTSALGIAASMSGGLMQFSQDPSGTMIKRLYGGLPAERGVLAAQLAAAGYTGPRESIEGRFGVARVLADRVIGEAGVGSDTGLVIDDVSVKLYACCRNFHALIDAARWCLAQGPIAAGDIARVEVRGPRAMIEHHLEARPRSTMAAQYSLPFTTAVALLGDPADPSSFGDAARDDPALLGLADKVSAVHDDAFQRAFPAHFGGAIAIVRRDGSRVEHRVLDSNGTPAKPADRATLHAKFAAMTARRLDNAGRDRLLRAIDALERMTTIDALVDALPKPVAEASPRSAVG